MLRKISLLSGVFLLLLFGAIAQNAAAASYGEVPEETRKMVRNLAGRWCDASDTRADYYNLIVTGDNTFIMEYKFSKCTRGQAVPMKSVFNMTVEGDSLEGTHTYWVDLSQLGFSVEEKTFPASGMISNNGDTINIMFDHPMPNSQDGGRWTLSEGRICWIFSRAR